MVTSVTGDVYAQDSQGHSTEAGDAARIKVRSDLPVHRDDYLGVLFYCKCGKEGMHAHNFRVAPGLNKLRVTIGRPKQL